MYVIPFIQSAGREQKILDSRQECFKLLSVAQLALMKATEQENDLRDARNNATLIDNQNKLNKELLDSIDKYNYFKYFNFKKKKKKSYILYFIN